MKTASNNKTRIELRRHEVTIPSPDGQSVQERIPIKVPMEWDAELGEWLLTAEAEANIENTKARYLGLLLPHELLELRQRLGLTQTQIGDLLQIGAKSWTRWETGKQRPSRSINLLLRTLQKGHVSLSELQEMNAPKHDWSAQFAALASQGTEIQPVSIDQLRPGLAPLGTDSACPEQMRHPA